MAVGTRRKYIIYDNNSGAIIVKRFSLLPFSPIPDNQTLLEVSDLPKDGQIVDIATGNIIDTYDVPYTLTGSPVIADGVSEAIISGLPVNTHVIADNMESMLVNDGEMIFTYDTPGTYEISLENVSFNTVTFYIEVTALP